MQVCLTWKRTTCNPQDLRVPSLSRTSRAYLSDKGGCVCDHGMSQPGPYSEVLVLVAPILSGPGLSEIYIQYHTHHQGQHQMPRVDFLQLQEGTLL